jgi:hypothetical protein
MIKRSIAFTCSVLLLVMAGLLIAGCEKKEASQAVSVVIEGSKVYEGTGKSYGPLTKPATVRFISAGPGNSDFADIGIIAAFLGRVGVLPAGSAISQETISAGTGGSGYLIEADMGDVARGQNAMAATRGYNGRPPYTKIRSLLSCSGNSIALQILSGAFVRKTGYTSFEQVIENKYPATFCTEDIGSSDFTVTTFLFEAYGLTMDDFRAWGGKIVHTDGNTASEMIQDGTADAIICMTSLTSSLVNELMMSTTIVLSGFSDRVVTAMVERGFVPRDIPPGHFGQFPNGAHTAYAGTSLIASADMPNEVAYNLTRLIMENCDTLGEECATIRNLSFEIATNPLISVVPFHPGSIAYFQDIGVMDANGKYIGEPKRK